MSEHFKFVQNTQCEYFPCHSVADPETFNCLFCYCPLYALGEDCGGNYEYLANGVKNCMNCLLPHKKENFEYVTTKLKVLIEQVKKK